MCARLIWPSKFQTILNGLSSLFYVTHEDAILFLLFIIHNVVMVLLIFVDIYHFDCTFSHAYTEAHTQAHMYDQHTRGRATTRHKSLVVMGGRKVFVTDLAQK